jgi:hypothetical protein
MQLQIKLPMAKSFFEILSALAVLAALRDSLIAEQPKFPSTRKKSQGKPKITAS